MFLCNPGRRFHINFGGNHILTTSDMSDMFVASFDSAGNCLGKVNFGEASGDKIVCEQNGIFYSAGHFADTVQLGNTSITSYSNSVFYGDGGDIYLAKHVAITGSEERYASNSNNGLIIYANPNAGKCNITVPDEFLNEKKLLLSIYDNTGKLIQQKTLEMNEGKIKLNLEAEAKGVYNVVLSNGKKSYNGKIVFQ